MSYFGPLLVFAENMVEFEEFRRSEGFNSSEATFIRDGFDLRGILIHPAIKMPAIGNFHYRKDAAKLIDTALARGIIVSPRRDVTYDPRNARGNLSKYV